MKKSCKDPLTIVKNFSGKFFLVFAAMLSVMCGFFVANMTFAITSDVVVSPNIIKGGSIGTTYVFTVTNTMTAPIYDVTITAPTGFIITDNLVCPTGWLNQSSTASSVECLGNGNPSKGLYIASGAQASISFSATAPASDSTGPWNVETVDNAYVSHIYNPVTLVDATAPVTTDSGVGSTSWQQGSVSITLTSTDIGGSSVASTLYCVGTETCDPTTSGTSVSVTADGENFVRYFSTDGVGNIETTKMVGPILIDNTPAVSTITVGTRNFGTGPTYIKSTSEISLSALDANSGVATPGTYYTIDGATAVSYTTAFTIAVPGAHTIGYKSIDNAGNEESIKTLSVFVDDINPTVNAITISHKSNSFISGTSDISAPVHDADGSGVATCEYTLNGSTWTTATFAGGNCSATGVDTSSASSINMRATDNLGNLGTGTAVAVTPDTTAPVTTDSGTDTAWHNADVTITLSSTDVGSDIFSKKYCVGAVDCVPSTEYSIGGIVVSANGINYVRFQSIDFVGNTEAIKTAVNTVKIDKNVPTITDNNVTGWKNADVTITLTPNDTTSGIAGVKYCEDETCDILTGTTLVDPYTLSFSANGTKVIHYQTMDNAGNASAVGTFTVQIDKISATTNITGPVSDSYNKGTVTIKADANDNIGGSGISKVEFYVGADKIGEDTTSLYSFEWNTSALNGDYSLTVVAVDLAGNRTTSAPAVVVHVDNAPPTLLHKDITGGFIVNANEMAFSPNGDTTKDTVGINVEFSEPVEASIKIKNSLGTTVQTIYTSSGYVADPNNYNWDGKDGSSVLLPDGLYTVEITGTDHAGNSVTDTSKTILLDNTAPTVDAGVDKVSKTDSAIDASATDTSGSGIATYAWTGTGLTFTSNNTEDTTVSASADGAYDATLSVTDYVGNHASDTMQFTRDSVAPTVVLTSPTVDSVNKNTVSLAFTPTEPTPGTALTCSYEIHTPVLTGTVSCTSGILATQSITGVPDGRHTITVTVTDEAGNTVTSSPVSFVVDTNNTLTVGATNADFITIQEAVTKATAGDAISIATGTYNESVLINKKLSLVGNGSTKPIISGLAPTDYIVKIDGTDAGGTIIDNLEVNGVTTGADSNGFNYGILVNNSGSVSSAVEIKNSIVKNIWKNGSNGIGVEASSYVLVHNNSISSFHKRGIRFINSSGKFYSNDVKGDSVDGTTRVQNLVNLWGGSTVEIYSNTLHDAKSLSGTTTWDSPAIFVSSYGGSGASHANIHDNEIYNGDTGITVGSVYVVSPDTDTSTVEVTNNNLYNLNNAINFEVNTTSAAIHGNKFVNNVKSVNADGITGPATNAEANWWGTQNGPVAGSVFANVDYRPWCTNEICNPVDTTLPTVTVNSLLTNDTTPTITGTVTEINLAIVKITVNSHEYTAMVTSGTWSAEVTTAITEGTYDVVATAEDLAGNVGTDVTDNELKIDTTAPIATIAYVPSEATSGDVVATMTPNETVTVTSEGGLLTHTFSANSSFTFTFVDTAGNAGTAVAKVENIDKVPPTEVTLENKPTLLTNSTTADITVGGADVSHYKYKLDGAESYSTERTVATHLTLSGLTDGSHTLSVQGRDAVGNWKADPTTYSWTIETVPPTVVSKTPSANAVGIDPASAITVTFSEAINIDPTKITVKKGEVPVTTTVTFDPTTKTATIQGPLENNATYTVTLLSTITDTAGNALSQTSWSFTTAVAYSIPLTAGWNLISLPVVPVNPAIASVLGTTKDNINAVYSYDVATGWKVYRPDGVGTSNLTEMTAGYGYWVEYKDVGASNIVGSGNLISEGNNTPPSRSLKEGWNLIGYYQRPNTTNISATNALANNLNNFWTLLFGYDNTDKHITPLNTGSQLSPGQGFWVWLTGDRSYTMGSVT
jgi:hypothetical protein